MNPVHPAAAAGIGAEGNAQLIAQAVAVAMAAVNAGRPPRETRIPRQLEWPALTADQLYQPPTKEHPHRDFAQWWVGYAELTAHVAPELRSLHLLTALPNAIRKDVETHFRSRGVEMRQVTIAELRAYVVRTYEPDDAVYTRICHFMQLR